MPSFYIPLTGLDADSSALNTIANNIANMNTTGFKAQTVNFSDLFYQQVGATGSGDPVQTGAGTQVSSITTDFTNGTPNATGVDTNVAIQGNGFFVVGNGSQEYLTRDGDFSTDSKGNLITANGMSVMGYPASNGVVNSAAPLQAINIPIGQVEPPQATTTLGMTINLDSRTSSAGTYSTTIDVYDSLGQPHTATIQFTQDSTATTPNTWGYSISLPSGDSTSSSGPLTGTLNFDSSGDLESFTPAGATSATAVGPGGASGVSGLTFSGLKDGANDLTLNWNLLGSAGTPTVTQNASSSSMSSPVQDGYAPGQYSGYTIGSDGTVTVTFDNDQKLNVGQIALGNVTNLQGLKALGNGDYSTTLASGAMSTGVSGSGGLGTMQSGFLEGSNVNISGEFSNLIIAQRAFEANSKAITTFDTITQETIQMIH